MTYSNTDRLYSQWSNSVIYWLINHCTDWAGFVVTSFNRQFDFHGVIYHIQSCNADNRHNNVVFTSNGRSKRAKKYAIQSEQVLQEILTLCLRWLITID